MTEIINKLIDWITYFKGKIDSMDSNIINITKAVENISISTGNNTSEIEKMKVRLLELEAVKV